MANAMTTLSQQYSAGLALRPSNGRYRATVSKPNHTFGLMPPVLQPFVPVAATARRSYDPRVAYLTTIVSAWAYSDGETMANQLPYYGLPNCSVTEFTVVNGAMLIVASAYFVRSEDGRVGVLAFRGTIPDDLINWLTDANTTLTNFHHGRVHTGFFRNVEPLWSKIADAIEDATQSHGGDTKSAQRLQPLENLYITGHSLGAAMAVIAAARIFTPDYASWQPLVRGVYTYGQPSVGDKVFGNHFGQQFDLYRHVYRTDVVPHMPPADVGVFVHFGTEFFSGGPGEGGWQQSEPPRALQARLVTAAAAIAVGDFLARRLTILRGLRLPYSLEDHGPQGYIDASRASLG